MEARAVLRYLRMSPRKVRPVADLVRGRSVEEALGVLSVTPRAAAQPLAKLIRSALANAMQMGEGVEADRLYVKRITVDQGPTLRRYRPRAMGRVGIIRKRTSHITVVLEER